MKKNRLLVVLLIVLVIALIAVLGVIAYKTQEYKASEDFYQSLRTGLVIGGMIA